FLLEDGRNYPCSSSLKYIKSCYGDGTEKCCEVLTALGEMHLSKKSFDSRIWGTLFLMIISAISGGVKDITFHAELYLADT
ncbi:hypothetical protein MKW98_027560, partial [Papaver atlanticum]